MPDLRQCVDTVAEGALRSEGSELIDDPNDLLGHSIFYYRFTPFRGWVGAPMRAQQLSRGAHSLEDVDVGDAIVLMRGKSMAAWEWVWRDRAGRKFIPITAWPDAKANSFDWRPQAIRQVARRVSYRPGQPYWFDNSLDKPGRPPVHYGLYLSDLARLFDLAGSEQCWR